MLSWVKKAFGSEPVIYVDPKRINPEIQAERRRELYENAGRRRKIMDRMMQGYACTHPSWIQEIAQKSVASAENPRPGLPGLAA
jgi:hypothetical protein